MDFSRQSAARETISEGAAEVKAKLRDDLSRWSRTRRFVSLKPRIPCMECDGAGKTQCSVCAGSGRSRMVLEDGRQEACTSCDGTGANTCVVCAGRGMVANAHRRTMLWVLGIGGVAWLLILFQLWGRDVLPEQRAAILQRGEHGNAVTAPPSRSPGGAPGGANPQQRGAVSGGVAAPAAGGQWAIPPQGGQPQGYSGAPQVQPGAPAPPGSMHGNSIQPGATGPVRGYGQPGVGGGASGQYGQMQGGQGVMQPSGGGNSIPSPPR